MMNLLKNIKMGHKGFTLFELLAVMVIMSVLASIAVPSYKRSQIKARESVLAEDLYQMRRSIDAFFADHGRYPDRLEQLTSNKYLRDIPRDPFTRTSDSWNCLPPEPAENGQLAEGGCFDVRSGSDLIGMNDIPYQEW
jgi:general secretion pathway protein G